jgi:hypothetical protein
MLDKTGEGRVSTRELAQFLDTLSPRDGNHCFSQVMSLFLLDFFIDLRGLVHARVARCVRVPLTGPVDVFSPFADADACQVCSADFSRGSR